MAAIQALGGGDDFGVDATAARAAVGDRQPRELPRLVFLNTSGNLLNSGQEAAVQAYVAGGGGFVGIGSAAEGEAGARSSTRSSAAPERSELDPPVRADRRVGDRVHPATVISRSWEPVRRLVPVADAADRQGPHARPLPRCRRAAGDGTDVGGTDHPISWCRDKKGGSSFYTGMGRTAAGFTEADFQRSSRRASAGPPACARRLQGDDQRELPDERIVNGGPSSTACVQRRVARPRHRAERLGALHRPRRLPNGRRSAARCRRRAVRPHPRSRRPERRHRLRHDPRLGPRRVHRRVNTGMTRAATLAVYADGGTGAERTDQADHKMEYGLLGITVPRTSPRPATSTSSTSRPSTPQLASGPGVDRRISKMSRPRISRFTIDLDTKQLDLSSEVRIFEYDAQIFSCCHVGGGMGFD